MKWLVTWVWEDDRVEIAESLYQVNDSLKEAKTLKRILTSNTDNRNIKIWEAKEVL